MQETIRYDKGLGNAAVYVRITNSGQFWDFVAQNWTGVEAANCHVFMEEFDDTSATQSWYWADLEGANAGPVGSGPYNIDIMLTGNLAPIGNDFFFRNPSYIGQVPVSAIITVVAHQLWDMSNIQWPSAVLLMYLNYAVREIVNLKPEAGSILGLIRLVAGTRQQIPANWSDLLNLKRNMGANGATPGLAITQIPVDTMDHTIPDWHTWPPDTSVRYIVDDDRDPLSFDVFPPQPIGTTQQVEAVGSAIPAKVTDPVNGFFPLQPEYEVVAADYMIYRALYESTSIPNAINKATNSLNKFYQSLGSKKKAEMTAQSQGGGL